VAGFGDSGRMVVKEHHGGGILLQGLLYYDPGINAGAVDGALKQLPNRDDPVSVIEKQATEDFVTNPPAEAADNSAFRPAWSKTFRPYV
jgi:hypothetical protein